jgi:5'-nucleotidase
LAIFGLGIKPDYVLSGVNAGGNLGQDLVISGTMAAAREAAYHGVPAAAFSHYLIRHIPVDWERTANWTAAVLGELLEQRLSDGEYWSVNFPHLPPGEQPIPKRVSAPAARPPLNVHFAETKSASGTTLFQYDAAYSERPRPPGSDVDICFGGQIAVTRLAIR